MTLSKNFSRSRWSVLGTQRAKFIAFVGFFVIVFFTGGSSRDDVQSLVFLRPAAILFCAYAITVKLRGEWKGRMAPLWFAFALVALMILQLLPLPPSIWTTLPERSIFADIATLTGMEQPWRPLTLSPSATMNSLFALTVPIAAMMLYLNLDRGYRSRTVPVLVILCLISAAWAIFQMSGPARGPLYLYRITNPGFGVGLFANRNHQAILLVSAIVMLGWYAGSLKSPLQQNALKFYASLSAVLVLVPLVFITGSRAGLLLMLPALFTALLLVYIGNYSASKTKAATAKRSLRYLGLNRQAIVLTGGILALAGISAGSILLSRSLAFERLFSDNDIEDLRTQVLPTLFSMLEKYLPLGSGFGTFEHVYKIYEPQELLRSSYLNEAHNDWLQYLIEGGIPALLIAAAAALWFAVCLHKVAKNWRSLNPAKYRMLMGLAVIILFVIASVADYPLRVPSIISVFSVFICIFNDAALSLNRDKAR